MALSFNQKRSATFSLINALGTAYASRSAGLSIAESMWLSFGAGMLTDRVQYLLSNSDSTSAVIVAQNNPPREKVYPPILTDIEAIRERVTHRQIEKSLLRGMCDIGSRLV